MILPIDPEHQPDVILWEEFGPDEACPYDSSDRLAASVGALRRETAKLAALTSKCIGPSTTNIPRYIHDEIWEEVRLDEEEPTFESRVQALRTEAGQLATEIPRYIENVKAVYNLYGGAPREINTPTVATPTATDDTSFTIPRREFDGLTLSHAALHLRDGELLKFTASPRGWNVDVLSDEEEPGLLKRFFKKTKSTVSESAQKVKGFFARHGLIKSHEAPEQDATPTLREEINLLQDAIATGKDTVKLWCYGKKDMKIEDASLLLAKYAGAIKQGRKNIFDRKIDMETADAMDWGPFGLENNVDDLPLEHLISIGVDSIYKFIRANEGKMSDQDLITEATKKTDILVKIGLDSSWVDSLNFRIRLIKKRKLSEVAPIASADTMRRAA